MFFVESDAESGFSHFRQNDMAFGDGNLVVATTPSGAGEVLAFTMARLNPDFEGGRLTRIGETIVPSGTVNYTGHSSEILTDQNYDLRRVIIGDVALGVNFADGSFEGDITNRHEIGTTNMEGFDVSLAGTYADGVLSGGANQNANNGSLTGLVVGANGEEVIGTFSIFGYGFTNDTDIIQGAFWVEDASSP